MKHFFSWLIVLLLAVFSGSAQTTHPKLKGWHLLNYQQDGYLGTGVKEAYELLKGRKSTTVIMAVIDSGVDTAQEDLRPNLWVNPKEIPGNGKDDDGNGYTDDIHGWNFCGSAAGENMSSNTYEIERVYHRWKKEFSGKKESQVPADQKFLFSQWKRSEKIIDKNYKEYKDRIDYIRALWQDLHTASRLISAYLGREEFTRASIIMIPDNHDSLTAAVKIWNNVFSRGEDISVTNIAIQKEVDGYYNELMKYRRFKEDEPVDYRGALTKDRYEDIRDSIYGNNNLKGSSGDHGTHVCGIIGAVRNNNIGVDGIVENVKVMMVRAAPGGDEHDKDVALAIRYAVDNGAAVINMSFGKPVSPYKQMVDDAIRYAADKGVLVVHGAGNDGANLEEEPFYPNPYFLDGSKATNMLTIGASGDYSTGGGLVASFSNYGPEVDIFAPGVYINSTISNNAYEPFDGTSMASPVAAGVAGLLKSYFPQLSPAQLIDIIIRSGTPIEEDVTLPGTDKKTKLKKLCSSGKIINAYAAVKLALELYGK